MKSYLSPHANGLLDDIIDAIADALSIADTRKKRCQIGNLSPSVDARGYFDALIPASDFLLGI